MFGLISLNGTADAPMLSNFTDHGGLFPNGFLAVFIAMIEFRLFWYRINRRYSRRISKSSKGYTAIHP
ncbi:hypothetical protein NRS6120_21740 [Bacillus subtilis]|nr:hypothetical protein NRS6120_03824 [Bacillus subtilis]CAI6327892.1 hypothetical protein NRS6120_21740 [Bacillus subtilis]